MASRTQDDPLENNVSDKPFCISLREETISAPGIPLDKMESNFRKDYPNFKSIYGGEEKNQILMGMKKDRG